jgi:hypothetical protein
MAMAMAMAMKDVVVVVAAVIALVAAMVPHQTHPMMLDVATIMTGHLSVQEDA